MVFRLAEVFGVSNKIVETYLYREDVDFKFIESLEEDKHIIIYGASKQGKTSLYKRHLSPEEYIIIECSPSSKIIDINKSILRQAGSYCENNISVTSENTSKDKLGASVKLKIPLLGELGINPELGEENKSSIVRNYSTYEYNLNLSQDVSEALKKLEFDKYIILENFHYLNKEAQSKLSFDLRTYHDLGIKFIILGVWREKNRLLQFNGDLIDRIEEITVEPWKRSDFMKIITLGESLLNIEFDNNLKDAIAADSYESVGVLQELCKEVCLIEGIKRTVPSETRSINDSNYTYALENKIDHYSSRHFRTFDTFVRQKNNKNSLFLPYYFLMVICKTDIIELQKGIDKKYIISKIKENHKTPEKINNNVISYFLNNLDVSQIRKKINPPLFDYDISSFKIRIIDSTLFFYLTYFSKEDLFREISNPTDLG